MCTSHGRGTRKSACPAWGKTCDLCGKANHFAAVCRSAPTTASGLVAHVAWDADKGAFKPTVPSDLASLTISVSLKNKNSSSNQEPHHDVSAHPDTGAQVSVAGPSLLATMGLSHDGLQSSTQRIRAAGGTPLRVLGYIPTLITIPDDITQRSTRGYIYRAWCIHDFLKPPSMQSTWNCPNQLSTSWPTSDCVTSISAHYLHIIVHQPHLGLQPFPFHLLMSTSTILRVGSSNILLHQHSMCLLAHTTGLETVFCRIMLHQFCRVSLCSRRRQSFSSSRCLRPMQDVCPRLP